MVILQTSHAALQSEVTSLRTQSNRPKSIWNMSKAELVEKAYEELGMSRAKAEEHTVTYLQQKLKRNKDLTSLQADPMAVMPKGLERLTKDALLKIMEERQLPLGLKPIRASMIVAITDHVLACQLVASSPDPHHLSQQDWETVDTMETEMPQPKSKATSKGMKTNQSASSSR